MKNLFLDFILFFKVLLVADTLTKEEQESFGLKL